MFHAQHNFNFHALNLLDNIDFKLENVHSIPSSGHIEPCRKKISLFASNKYKNYILSLFLFENFFSFLNRFSRLFASAV